MEPPLKHRHPYTAAMLQLICQAADATAIFDDIAGVRESTSHAVIASLLDFTGRDSFNVALDIPTVVRAYAEANPTAPVCVVLTGVRDPDGTGLFYAMRHKDGAPSMSRQVVLGSEIQRKQFGNITVAGSHHQAVPGYEAAANALTDDYCSDKHIVYTIASSPLRTFNAPDKFPLVDPAHSRFVPWSGDEWHEYTPFGHDFAADMLAGSPTWRVGCADIEPVSTVEKGW